MPLLGAIAIASAGLSAIQYGVGLARELRAKKDYNEAMRNRPIYSFQLPGSYDMAVREAYKGMLGVDLDPYRGYAAGVTSRQADLVNRYALTSQQAIGAIGQAYARELDSFASIAMDELKTRDMNRQQYINALMQKAGVEFQGKLQEFEYNQWLPWQMKLNYLSGQAASGQSLMTAGFQNALQIGLNYAAYDYKTNKLGRFTSAFDEKQKQKSEEGSKQYLFENFNFQLRPR